METQVDRTFRFSHGLGIAAGIAAKTLKAFWLLIVAERLVTLT